MPVLIDGNNLLFAAAAHDPERPPGRHRLCELLGRWGRRMRQRVDIVFDGPPPPAELLAQMGGLGVGVAFSGGGVTADERISERIRQCSAPRRLVVVSTDHAVAQAARRRRCASVRSEDFWPRLLLDLAAPPRRPLEPEQKRAGLAENEVEAWERELGLEP